MSQESGSKTAFLRKELTMTTIHHLPIETISLWCYADTNYHDRHTQWREEMVAHRRLAQWVRITQRRELAAGLPRKT